MIQQLKKNYMMILILVFMLGTAGKMFYTVFEQRQLYPGSEIPFEAFREIYATMILAVLGIFVMAVGLVVKHISRLYKTQSWLINVVRSQGERLAFIYPKTDPEALEKESQIVPAHRWPWGGHHTEYLGHLEAAARKWWALYDPSDSTTAPTNEMVSDWLQSDRNLSRERARAIASMLRPDGLPTGPRK